jgi:hypothetical protein
MNMYRVACVSPGILILLAAALAPARQAASPQPSARELFYAAPASAKPAPAKTASRPKPAPPPARASTETPPPAPGGPPPAEGNALPGGGHVIRASAESGPPLGMRYSIVRLVNGRMIETPADYVFHAGDHIQINVQTNTPGYLYVVNKGSSGAWSPIFPSPKIANGDNHVDGFHTYTLPTSEYWISFDQLTGTENVTIVFSREPVPDFEELIYSLQGKPMQPARQAQPEGGAPPPPKKMVMMASVSIDDSVMGRLRASTRDLIVEHVDTSTPADSTPGGDRKETAVYVVNRAGSPNSRLLAELHLVHQ